MDISFISQERLLNAKLAYTPRNLDLEGVTTLLSGEDVVPRSGDIVLAKVTKIGHHAGLELAHGRRSGSSPTLKHGAVAGDSCEPRF